MERPTVTGHPNEISVRATDRRFENKFTRAEPMDDPLRVEEDDDDKFIRETKAELAKSKKGKSSGKSRLERFQGGVQAFSMGAEKVGRKLDVADNYLSGMDFGITGSGQREKGRKSANVDDFSFGGGFEIDNSFIAGNFGSPRPKRKGKGKRRSGGSGNPYEFRWM